MYRTGLRIAWRNLFRNKFYSAINIVGLSVGLAVGIMILLWVQDELSYDRFHKHATDIYKINSHVGTEGDGGVWDWAPGPITLISKRSVPEVRNVVRINKIDEELLFKYRNRKFTEREVAFVDSSFLSVFDFELVKGDKSHLFPTINTLVISASTARKYFGEGEAVGQVLATDFGNFTVSGVIKDFPQNSSLQYDMLLPMAFYADMFAKRGGNGDWKTIDEDLGNFSFLTFLQLHSGADPRIVGQKITKIYQDIRKGEVPGVSFSAQPFTQIHLVKADGNSSSLQTVRIFLLVAILILVIACVNYVNLSTARSMLRSREVSVRKIIGARKYQLITHFFMESALVFVFAISLSIIIVYMLLPFYNEISGKHFVFSLARKEAWMVIGVAVSGTLLLSALYPAILLSSFKPVLALKGKISSGFGAAGFRKALVVMQFVFSAGLIIGTIVITKQLQFIRSKDMGYNKEHVLSFVLKGFIGAHTDAVRTDLLNTPGIVAVASSANSIHDNNASTTDTDWDGKEEGRAFMIYPNVIDEHLIPLLKMPLVKGKNFTGSGMDSAHYILNETAVRQAGIKDPIGKRFSLWSKPGTIIGVVKDFNYASLQKKIEPAIFKYGKVNSKVYVKAAGHAIPQVVAATGAVWKKYGSEYPFTSSFLEDDFNRMYLADQRTGILFNVFAVVAIIISCLGLFGLATYTAEARIKEIGIRKVLGASVLSITRLLAREFVVLVLIAFGFAVPGAWYLMNGWLQNYAYRTDIGWWIFGATGILTLLVALLTVSFQAIKAALTNPIKTLRTE